MGISDLLDNLGDRERITLIKVPRWSLVILLYFLFQLAFEFAAGSIAIYPWVAAWYPPNGILLAFLLAFGPRFAPVVALVSFIANQAVTGSSMSVIHNLGWSVLNTAVCTVSSVFMKNILKIDLKFTKVMDFLKGTAVVAVQAILMVLIPVSALVQVGFIAESKMGSAIFHWFMGEMVGVIAFTPVILVHFTPRISLFLETGKIPKPSFQREKKYYIQLFSQFLSMIIFVYAAFSIKMESGFHLYYIILAPLLWVALKNGFQRATMAVAFTSLVSMTAVWLTSFDVNQLGEVQFVLAVIFMTTLVIGAIVTENNAIFKELVRKDVFHSSLIEHAPDGINMLSRDFQIDYLSPSSQKILGHDPGALIGTFLTDYIHPDDIKPAQDLLQKIIANDGATAMAEYRFKHADGGWIWLESTITNLLGEKDIDKIVINFRDITERKRSAQEIIDTQARFENVVNSANDAILSMDEHQNIILFNRGAERIFGIKSEEALGMPLTTFLPDAPTHTHQQFIDQRKEIDTVSVLPNLVYGRRINGDRFPAEINISQVTFKGKAIFSAFLRDVSKHMQAEEQVRTSKDDLQTLYEFSHTLAQTFTLEEILKIINKYTVDSINLTYSRIALLEDGFYVMRSVYPPFPRGNVMLIGEGFLPESLPTIQRVVEQNKPALILADKGDFSEEEYRILRLDFTKSLYILPLCLGSDETFDKRILGVLMLGEMRSEEREPITPGKMRLAQTIADTQRLPSAG